MYGVNWRAILSTLSFFNITSGALITDIMHDIVEGALHLEVKLMLKVHRTCSDPYCTILNIVDYCS